MPRNSKNGGLGKGLSALIPSTVRTSNKENSFEIEIDTIEANPFQPRKAFAEDELYTLRESIKQHGLIQPIVVRKTDTGYQLVAGERRWRACKELGLQTIPAIVKDYNTEEITEIALVENLQRQNLDPIEEAYAYKKLMDTFKQTQETIAGRLGRSRSHVANMVRLLQLPEFLQNELSAGELTVGQVRPLLSLKQENLQLEALQYIKEHDLNARQIEDLVKRLQRTKEHKPKEEKRDSAELRSLTERLKSSLGTAVAIKLQRGKKIRGRIEISFASEEELLRLMSYLEDENSQIMDEEGVQSFRV